MVFPNKPLFNTNAPVQSSLAYRRVQQRALRSAGRLVFYDSYECSAECGGGTALNVYLCDGADTAYAPSFGPCWPTCNASLLGTPACGFVFTNASLCNPLACTSAPSCLHPSARTCCSLSWLSHAATDPLCACLCSDGRHHYAGPCAQLGSSSRLESIGTLLMLLSPTTMPLAAVNGNWSDWSAWSTCVANNSHCGGGTYARNRTCNDPEPEFGGAGCSGAAYEVAACDTGIACGAHSLLL